MLDIGGRVVIVLETERLLFRDHAPGDLEGYCAMEADPEVRRFVGGTPRTREAAERKFREVYLAPVPDRMGLWATVFKPESRYVGYCGVYGNRTTAGVAAGEGVIGFYLARGYWGRGLATEAGRAFVDFGFAELGMSRIIAHVDSRNAASIHVLEKLGLVRVGSGKAGARTIDEFELLRSAWFPSRGPDIAQA